MNSEQKATLEQRAGNMSHGGLGEPMRSSVLAALARIAELEAALEKYGCHVVPCPAWSGEGKCACGFDGIKTPALDALLAQAKREALGAAADRFKDEDLLEEAACLRQMAREVKP